VPLMDHPKVIGLAEFMNFPGVLMKDPGCLEKLEAFQGRHIDGHAPLLRGNDLNGYISAGIRTEHEATTAEEGLEKLRKGMRVLIREGSVSKDLHALAAADRTPSPYLCLCTDDRNPLDIAEHGHLDYMIRTRSRWGPAAGGLSRGLAVGGRGLRAEGPRVDRAGQAGRYRGDRQPGGLPCRWCWRGAWWSDAAFAARATTAPVARHSVKAPKVAPQDFRTGGNRARPR
jgi:adenine deaminase